MTGRLRLGVAALGFIAACGCGQKGALYLPDPAPQAVKTSPAAPAPAPERRKTPAAPDPAMTQ